MEIIRINFLLKFVLPKRSSQNICKSLFLEKRKHLLLSCYCVTSSEGFGESPNMTPPAGSPTVSTAQLEFSFYILQPEGIFYWLFFIFCYSTTAKLGSGRKLSQTGVMAYSYHFHRENW